MLGVFGFNQKQRRSGCSSVSKLQHNSVVLQFSSVSLSTKMRLIIISGRSEISLSMEGFSVALCYWKEFAFLSYLEVFFHIDYSFCRNALCSGPGIHSSETY